MIPIGVVSETIERTTYIHDVHGGDGYAYIGVIGAIGGGSITTLVIVRHYYLTKVVAEQVTIHGKADDNHGYGGGGSTQGRLEEGRHTVERRGATKRQRSGRPRGGRKLRQTGEAGRHQEQKSTKTADCETGRMAKK